MYSAMCAARRVLFFNRSVAGTTFFSYSSILSGVLLLMTVFLLLGGRVGFMVVLLLTVSYFYTWCYYWGTSVWVEYSYFSRKAAMHLVYKLSFLLVILVEVFFFSALFYVLFAQRFGFVATTVPYLFDSTGYVHTHVLHELRSCGWSTYLTSLPRAYLVATRVLYFFPLLGTLLLVCSSYILNILRCISIHGETQYLYLMCTVVCAGYTFMYLQCVEFSISYCTTTTGGAGMYLLIGCHLVHVFFGILFIQKLVFLQKIGTVHSIHIVSYMRQRGWLLTVLICEYSVHFFYWCTLSGGILFL